MGLCTAASTNEFRHQDVTDIDASRADGYKLRFWLGRLTHASNRLEGLL